MITDGDLILLPDSPFQIISDMSLLNQARHTRNDHLPERGSQHINSNCEALALRVFRAKAVSLSLDSI
jgi:hypothetical protein